ncbi:hypothetical protein Premu_1589 [Hallella multisaccharivorax DSM 17128]|uniref:Uncharacterized protein n=1 Tax=Hallella multisaccharivorax DSM 17128 TaxID=688246 RepID=F8NC35_9BACT|nr:hypothetical protein Premu_1589 [Hallella multisaccharivorax DSM 17128]
MTQYMQGQLFSWCESSWSFQHHLRAHMHTLQDRCFQILTVLNCFFSRRVILLDENPAMLTPGNCRQSCLHQYKVNTRRTFSFVVRATSSADVW